MSQHIAATARKARSMLGWTTSDPEGSLRATVRWHLAHPPPSSSLDFAADDRALASV
jgi:hypothetical protein